jgi:hypothetical protein
MLTLQFRQICYNELQFVITFSEVKAYSSILGAKSITSSLIVISAVVTYQLSTNQFGIGSHWEILKVNFLMTFNGLK